MAQWFLDFGLESWSDLWKLRSDELTFVCLCILKLEVNRTFTLRSVIVLSAPQFYVIRFLKNILSVSVRLHVQLLQYVRNSLEVLHVY